MKKIVLLLLACLAGTALPGAVSVQVDLVSRYIWRGFDLLPDDHAAVQPGVSFEFGDSGFTLDVWGSFALTKREVLRDADEIDLTVSYTWSPVPGWEWTAGVIGYGYGFADDFSLKDGTSLEVYASVAATGLPLAPALAFYYDFNLGKGFYVSLSGSHEFKVNEMVGVEVGGWIGFNGRQYIERSGFSDVGFHVRTPLALGKLMLTPSLNFMIPLLDEVNEHAEFWFALTAEI